MRQQTLNQFAIAVNEVRAYFQKDIIRTSEYLSFEKSRPDITVPAAFMQVCRGDVRGTVDLTKYEKFIADLQNQSVSIPEVVTIAQPEETDDQIEERINLRFDVMDMMAKAAIQGNCRSMIISGAAGVGKSFTIMKAISNLPEERTSVLKGRVSPIGVFRTLWKHRFDNHVIVFDDANVFDHETSLDLLKAACDSSDERYITWASNTKQFDEEGEEIPSTFEFNGSVIFLTNVDFKEEIKRETKLAPHLKAMVSRSHYVSLDIRTEREYMIRIKSVVYKTNMMEEFDDRTRDEVVQFIDMNKDKMDELSLRMVKKIADLTKISPENWRKIASVSCFK